MTDAAPDFPEGFAPFAGDRVVVLGLGRAGLPAARRLRDWGATVTVWDDGEARRAEAGAEGFVLHDPSGEPFVAGALLLSPGIPHYLPRAHPGAARAAEAGAPILCDVEFLFRAVRATGSGARFVGITGTNGKTTTTALLAHLLRRTGRAVAEGGNLGPAALGLPLLGDDGVYVLEMSSYMLERLDRTRFDIGCVLNLSPDHLDRHGDMAGYAAAKARVLEGAGMRVVGTDDDATAALGEPDCVPISGREPRHDGVWAEGSVLRDGTGPIVDLSDCSALPGPHNAQNAAAAAAMAMALGLSHGDIAAGLQSYPGLPHRQERVGTVGAVDFVNDSKATNADSTAFALRSYDRVVWIAGGVPKAGGIESLGALLDRVAHAELIGQAAGEFAAVLHTHGVSCHIAETLDAAVPAAYRKAVALGVPVVLLSPACASFDQFGGFEARGDAFRNLVHAGFGGAAGSASGGAET